MRATGPNIALALLLTVGALSAKAAPAPSEQHAATPDTLSCGQPPCVLPPTQASEGGSTMLDAPIEANPANTSQLLLGSIDYNCLALGFHLSSDGGSTWKRVLCMPPLGYKGGRYSPCDEPSVGYDHSGNAYVSGLYCGAKVDHTLVAVQRSADGKHWSKPVVALFSAGPGETTPYLTHLTVDASPSSPFAGSVYVSGVMVTDQGSDNQVLVSHSLDGGSTWTQVAVAPIQKFPEQDEFTRMATDRSGIVYATWMRCTNPCSTGRIMLSRSSDGGTTWSTPMKIATVHDWDLPHTYERVYNYPSIAVDNSDGPCSGNIYVVMYNWTGSYLKVQMIRSTDGGETWSKPLPLAPKSDTHDQFFPAISVSRDGLVGVSWLDRRNDPNDIDYQAFGAISYDGGRAFGPNWQLTTAFSNPKVNGTGDNWMGDYTGNTWVGDKFIAAWMDSSNGVDMQEVVGGVRLK